MAEKLQLAVLGCVKSNPMTNVSKTNGGLESRRQSGEEEMAEKENGSGFESLGNCAASRARRIRRVVHRHHRESRQTGDRVPGIRDQVGQGNPARSDLRRANRYGKKFVERSADAARSLWRLE